MPDEFQDLIDVLGHEGFRGGLLAGAAAAALLGLLTLLLRRSLPGWGVGLASAVGTVLAVGSGVDIYLILRLVLVAAGGYLVSVSGLAPNGRWGLAVRTLAWASLGITVVWFTTTADESGVSWVPLAFPLIVGALGAALWAMSRNGLMPMLGPMFLVSVLGVWVTVPETDLVVILLGAAIPMALVTPPPIRARTSAAGAFAVAAVFVWLSVQGGEVRPWSLVGGLATAGVLLILPLVVAARHRPPRMWLTLGVQVGYVVVVTRVTDMTESEFTVVVVAIILVILAASVLLLTSPDPRPRQPVGSRRPRGEDELP